MTERLHIMNKENMEKLDAVRLLNTKKNEAVTILKLSEEIHKLCEKDEPDIEKINGFLKKRQEAIDKINELDKLLKQCQNDMDEGIGKELKEIFQKAKNLDDASQKRLIEKHNEYQKSLKNISKSIKISSAYKVREPEISGQFIDTKE